MRELVRELLRELGRERIGTHPKISFHISKKMKGDFWVRPNSLTSQFSHQFSQQFSHLQNLCLPIVTVIGLDHIHLFVAVEGLK